MSTRKLSRTLLIAIVACVPAVVRGQSVGVNWRSNLDAAMIEAAQTNRLLLLHFYTPSCGPCRAMDMYVFSQPQVAAAVEQDYVPVKIDADAWPAIASKFRVDRVPTEIIMNNQGAVLSTPPIPDKPEAYVTQLQNLARHFRQASAQPRAGSPNAPVNRAYANLPVSQPGVQTPAAAPITAAIAGQGAAASVAQSPQSQSPIVSTTPAQPQVQNNPYVTAPSAAAYGQAQAAYPAQQSTRYAQLPVPQVSPAQPQMQPQVGAAANQIASATPMMPSNAMPRSYRNSITDTPAGPAAAVSVAGPTAANNPAASPAAQSPAVAQAPAFAAQPQVAAQQAPVQAQPPVQAQATAPPIASVAASSAPAAPPATTTAQAAAPPAPRRIELPAGCPPVAFDGCCPVTLRTLKKWAQGDAQFGAIHRGRTYLFIGAQQRDQFLADPDSYSPVFAGLDPVLLLDKQQSVEGRRQFGFEYGGAFYLFASEETKNRFAASPQTYAAGVRQAMARVDASAPGATFRR